VSCLQTRIYTLTFTPATEGGGYLPEGGFCKISSRDQRNVTIVCLWHCQWTTTWGLRDKWRHHYIYFGFFATGLYCELL